HADLAEDRRRLATRARDYHHLVLQEDVVDAWRWGEVERQPLTVRRPGVGPDLPPLGRYRLRRPGPDVDHPEPLMLVVGVPHAGVVALFLALLLLLRLGIGEEDRQEATVGRPGELLHVTLLVEDAPRFASVGRHDVDALLAPLGPVGEERQAASVGRPARFLVIPLPCGELARLTTGKGHDPDRRLRVLLLLADRPQRERDPLAVGRDLRVARSPVSDQLLGCERLRDAGRLLVICHRSYLLVSSCRPAAHTGRGSYHSVKGSSAPRNPSPLTLT